MGSAESIRTGTLITVLKWVWILIQFRLINSNWASEDQASGDQTLFVSPGPKHSGGSGIKKFPIKILALAKKEINGTGRRRVLLFGVGVKTIKAISDETDITDSTDITHHIRYISVCTYNTDIKVIKLWTSHTSSRRTYDSPSETMMDQTSNDWMSHDWMSNDWMSKCSTSSDWNSNDWTSKCSMSND